MRMDDHAGRWERVSALFDALLPLSPEAQRERLDALRTEPDGAALAALVESLLAEDAVPRGAFDVVAAGVQRSLGAWVAESAAAEEIPARIGPYQVTGVLGAGGMGIVYQAEQHSPRRPVALKVVRSGAGAELPRRFQREAELHGRLQHPNIALVHEAGMAVALDAGGRPLGAARPYFAMELVRGEPLVTHAERSGMGVAARVQVMIKVCQAIAHAHERGVIHRDLKSANILVDERGEPKVLDFGIARASESGGAATQRTTVGEVIGTLPYMSPEQVRGDEAAIGVRSDVYALGVVLYELLSGRRPLDLTGRPLPEAVRMVAEIEPPRLGTLRRALRGDLETIVAACLEKEPGRRYSSAAELAADLRRYLEHEPIAARSAGALLRAARFARRHRALVAGSAVAAVALLGATVVSLVMAARAVDARDGMARQLRVAEVEMQRSTQSFAFFRSLLTAAARAADGGRTLTVRDFVLRAAGQIERPQRDAQVAGMLTHVVGDTLRRIGEMEAAERLLRRAVEIQRRPDAIGVRRNAYLAAALVSLGDLLVETERGEEALPVYLEAVEMPDDAPDSGPETLPGMGAGAGPGTHALSPAELERVRAAMDAARADQTAAGSRRGSGEGRASPGK